MREQRIVRAALQAHQRAGTRITRENLALQTGLMLRSAKDMLLRVTTSLNNMAKGEDAALVESAMAIRGTKTGKAPKTLPSFADGLNIPVIGYDEARDQLFGVAEVVLSDAGITDPAQRRNITRTILSQFNEPVDSAVAEIVSANAEWAESRNKLTTKHNEQMSSLARLVGPTTATTTESHTAYTNGHDRA